MLASASCNSWKKLHFSALPSDLNLCAAYFLFHQPLGRLCLVGGSCSSPRDTAVSQGMVATSRASVPRAGTAGKVSILCDPAMVEQELPIPCVTLSSQWPSCCTCRSSRSCVCPLLVSLMQESCWQSTEGAPLRWQGPSARSPTLLGISFPTQPVLWLCGSVNLPGGSQHSSDNEKILPCPLASSKDFICDITKYLLCFKTKREGMSLLAFQK